YMNTHPQREEGGSTMRTVIVNVVAGLLFLVLMAPPAFAADSCGGGCPKSPSNARAVSATFVPLATYPGNTLAATLAKGKTKRILHAEGMLTDGSAGIVASRAYGLGITVN